MVSLWWGQSALDELIERATSELLPAGQEDLELHFEISDQIRSKKVSAKDAMRSLKRRLEHKNPNVQLATLSLVDTCVKNGGDAFVREIASREFMDPLVSIVRSPTGYNSDVKNKTLAVIQTWGLAAKGKPSISYFTDVYNLLRAEGHTFPPVKDGVESILLETSAPPEWTDSDVCERCRTPFTMTNRKHHCRHCGKTFCQQCSGKTMALPHIGINEEVRVCDGCYIKLKLAKAASKDGLPPLPTVSSASLTTQSQTLTKQPEPLTTRSDADDEFDEDMKKAIEMSLKEAEQRRTGYGAGYTPAKPTQSQPASRSEPVDIEEDDPDLAAAIAASLQDMKVSSPASYAQPPGVALQDMMPNKDDISRVEMENIELFSTLIERIHARGGDVANDPQINKLYTQIGALQPKLVKTLDEVNNRHRTFVMMHEKLNAAVKAYDRLLEQRVAGAYKRQEPVSYGAGYGMPNASVSVESGYPQASPGGGYQHLYPTITNQPPATSAGCYQQPQSYSAPVTNPEYLQPPYIANTQAPDVTGPSYQQYPQQSPYYQYPPSSSGPHYAHPQQKQPHVDEAPLIDLS